MIIVIFDSQNQLFMRHYTKHDLESVVFTQLENLNAMNDLIGIMKTQNELLRAANEKIKREIDGKKEKLYSRSKGKSA